MIMIDLFEQLRDKIDHLGFGLQSDGDAAINYVKAFFTEEDAEYALAMSMDTFDTAEDMAPGRYGHAWPDSFLPGR